VKADPVEADPVEADLVEADPAVIALEAVGVAAEQLGQ